MQLKPKDSFTHINNAQNVLQGVSSYKKNWFVTQAVGNKRLLFNLLNRDGISIANRQLNYASHGQDLSIEEINSTTLYLYTVGRNNRGIVRFKVYLPNKRSKKLDIRWDREFLRKRRNSTVTISEDKRYFVTYHRGVISVYQKENLKEISRFRVLKEQQKKWFQGIAMYGEIIFTLSGKNSVRGKKIVSLYTLDGILIDKHYILAKEIDRRVYHKNDSWELEGLTFRDNSLFTTINRRVKRKNSKQLLEILTIEEKKE